MINDYFIIDCIIIIIRIFVDEKTTIATAHNLSLSYSHSHSPYYTGQGKQLPWELTLPNIEVMKIVYNLFISFLSPSPLSRCQLPLRGWLRFQHYSVQTSLNQNLWGCHGYQKKVASLKREQFGISPPPLPLPAPHPLPPHWKITPTSLPLPLLSLSSSLASGY